MKKANDDACQGSGAYVRYDVRITNSRATCRFCQRVLTLSWSGLLPHHGYTMSEVER